jgi:hypothetical protein
LDGHAERVPKSALILQPPIIHVGIARPQCHTQEMASLKAHNSKHRGQLLELDTPNAHGHVECPHVHRFATILLALVCSAQLMALVVALAIGLGLASDIPATAKALVMRHLAAYPTRCRCSVSRDRRHLDRSRHAAAGDTQHARTIQKTRLANERRGTTHPQALHEVQNARVYVRGVCGLSFRPPSLLFSFFFFFPFELFVQSNGVVLLLHQLRLPAARSHK